MVRRSSCLTMTDDDLSNLLMLGYMVALFSYTAYRLWKARDDD